MKWFEIVPAAAAAAACPFVVEQSAARVSRPFPELLLLVLVAGWSDLLLAAGQLYN